MGKKKKYDIERELREWSRGARRVVIVGIGNPIRMDDFVGVKIVRDLKGKVDSDRVMLIKAETVPENHMQEIIDYEPTHILIIDAAITGLKPGESRLMSPKQLANFPAYSTHMLPMRIFCECVMKAMRTKIALLLIEPKNADFGEGLTREAAASVLNTVNALLRILA